MEDFLERISQYSPKRLALLAAELQSRVQQLEWERRQPIAIVGIGCRMPGGASTPDLFWKLIRDGVDAISEVPPDRWRIDDYYNSDPDVPGKMNTRFGGFVSGVDDFDAQFFGIAPREARTMDPQQRMLLEVTWEALEHAGIAASKIADSSTGVFVGLSASDYFQLVREGGAGAFDAYTASGTAHSIASGRLSYVLGATGPSVSVDTACSSSLMTIHLAVQSLRRGECDTALAGGVNLILGPDVTIALSRSHMMAPDGRCKTFDRRADGFVRGEGCGILVLKRLVDAERDRDNVVAVIRGSAANQDGRSNGLTAPNGRSQELVLQGALNDARIKSAEVSYVEAHGTGTSLGDPIEVRALANVFAGDRESALMVGSVKANIGHLEAAAGVAGVIKLAMALRHGEIPAQINLNELNPLIAWDEISVRVSTQCVPWPETSGPRVGGVSSFGFSGTNVHLLLEQAPPLKWLATAETSSSQVIAVSARQEGALRELARRYGEWLEDPGIALSEAAYSINTGRAHFGHRLAIVAKSREEAATALISYASGEPKPELASGLAPNREPRVAFLFTGQGAQYAGMARELYDSQPRFREIIDHCNKILTGHLSRSLISILFDTEAHQNKASGIDDTQYTQPALFAVEYGLAKLWMSWGVQPAAVLGHSVGEYVAACIAGIFSLEDALKLVTARGRLMSDLPRDGAMASVMCGESKVREAIAPWSRELGVAAVNGPANVVISGRAAAVEAVIAKFQAEHVHAVRLNVSHAFHSPLVEPMIDRFIAIARTVEFSAPQIDLVSNVTGRLIGKEIAGAEYWAEHVRAPVMFAPALETLADCGCQVFLEVGPHPTLLGLGADCLPDHQIKWLASLRRGRSDNTQMLHSAASLYAAGATLDWAAIDGREPRPRLVMPGYPFQRERFWVDPPASKQAASPPNHEEIDRLRQMLHEVVWRDAPLERGLSFSDIPRLLVPDLEQLIAETKLDRYAEFTKGLNELVTRYILKGARELGLTITKRTTLRRSDAARLGVLSRHERLFNRIFAILAEDGIVVDRDDGWHVVVTPTEEAPETLYDRLLAAHPDCDAELELTRACANNLADVLRGRIDPLTLLFPGGSLEPTKRLYRHSPPARVYNALVAKIVKSLAASVRRDRSAPIRILEIGAGTGSTTAHVIPELSEEVEYTFTDVSPAFLNHGREHLAERRNTKLALLNIERDPVEQGFVPKSYDIVLAANVLHATSDLGQSLEHARDLLAPGGTLVLLEGTAPQRFGDVTVGLLEGWWAFSDTQRRSYALLSQKGWLDLLAGQGFAEALAFPGDTKHEILSQQQIFVARVESEGVSAATGRWLLVEDSTGIATALSELLVGAGDTAEVLSAKAEGFGNRMRDALISGRPVRGIIHLSALDAVFNERLDAATLMLQQRRLIESTLLTVQTAVSQAGRKPPQLWLVSRGGQYVDESSSQVQQVDPSQATLWGVSHVIAIEHPELRCKRIDLDPTYGPAEAAERLCEELKSGGDEDQIAWRGQKRSVRRLMAGSFAQGELYSSQIGSAKTYLITGGLRGLGLVVAQWLVDRGARHLALMGRHEPDDQARKVLQRFEAAGIQTLVACGDVSRRDDVRTVLNNIAEIMPPLAGVVHAAGILDDGVIVAQNWQRFEQVMGPKILGTWHLHQLTRELPRSLDFMVLFSSGASLAGSAGQANHAAANAFEDAFAWYRQAQGYPTLSINWGPWADVGAAAERRLDHPAFLHQIAPTDGLYALDLLMRRANPTALFKGAQFGVLAVDWTLFVSSGAAAQSTLFRGRGVDWPRPAKMAVRLVAGAQSDAAAQSGGSGSGDLTLHERLLAALPNRRPVVLRDAVRAVSARVLGLSSPKELDMNESLRQLGLDSLMSVELRNSLSKAVGQTLPVTITFDYPSVAAISDYLAATEFSSLFGAELSVNDVRRKVGSPTRNLDDLTEDEVATQLMDRLNRIGVGEAG